MHGVCVCVWGGYTLEDNSSAVSVAAHSHFINQNLRTFSVIVVT